MIRGNAVGRPGNPFREKATLDVSGPSMQGNTPDAVKSSSAAEAPTKLYRAAFQSGGAPEKVDGSRFGVGTYWTDSPTMAELHQRSRQGSTIQEGSAADLGQKVLDVKNPDTTTPEFQKLLSILSERHGVNPEEVTANAKEGYDIPDGTPWSQEQHEKGYDFFGGLANKVGDKTGKGFRGAQRVNDALHDAGYETVRAPNRRSPSPAHNDVEYFDLRRSSPPEASPVEAAPEPVPHPEEQPVLRNTPEAVAKSGKGERMIRGIRFTALGLSISLLGCNARLPTEEKQTRVPLHACVEYGPLACGDPSERYIRYPVITPARRRVTPGVVDPTQVFPTPTPRPVIGPRGDK